MRKVIKNHADYQKYLKNSRNISKRQIYCPKAKKPKISYETQQKAERANENFYDALGVTGHSYFCEACQAWHLGKGLTWETADFNNQIYTTLQEEFAGW